MPQGSSADLPTLSLSLSFFLCLRLVLALGQDLRVYTTRSTFRHVCVYVVEGHVVPNQPDDRARGGRDRAEKDEAERRMVKWGVHFARCRQAVVLVDDGSVGVKETVVNSRVVQSINN
ncbi:unnamed protein product [Protopolystoma xenopodis]|uniref:Secreted protein n=1 Tax=Protopolystoma xenopodis TaxID=117903 RepID=A0A3S5CLE5_9PLAT|nr:unnamed protein product [Protopolystoma xenopodis]